MDPILAVSVLPFARAAVFGLLAGSVIHAQDSVAPSVYEQVSTLIQQAKIQEAEQTLRLALRKRPNDLRALSLLGVTLDAQERYREAERCYISALRLMPGSMTLQNNLGNHYLARGMRDRAEVAFLQVVAANSRHPNANLQLAQISLAKKQGARALRYLDNLPSAEERTPAVKLLRARALYQAEKKSSAEELLAQLEQQSVGDSRLAFSVGMVLVDWERFEDAERSFNRALAAAPASFDILYNLGLAANRAGHFDRAEEVFDIALRQRPNDVDCLLGLARVYAQRGRDRDYDAAALLVQAQRMAPERSDIPLFLAQLAERLGFFEDAARAYDRYLKLQPDNDIARRERGFALARSGKLRDGLRDLQWYVSKHPREARGLYVLALAVGLEDREKSLQYLNQVLIIDPDLVTARYARAVLNVQGGDPASAIEDLKVFLQHDPANVRAWDQLGQAYLLLEDPQQAVRAFSHALDLSPEDRTVLIHHSRALRKLGRTDELKDVLARFKQVVSDEPARPPQSGLFDYLSLSRAEQHSQYLAYLKKSVNASPKDYRLKLQLGKMLISQGNRAAGVEGIREIRTLTADVELLAECGKVLLKYGEYEAAREFLEAVVAANPAASEARLDLTIAIFHSRGPKPALIVLDTTSIQQRQGNYYLLRAQLLDALGRFEEAVETLNRGFRTAPTRLDLYFQASLFLIKHEKYSESLALLQQAVKFLSDAPQLVLAQAFTLQLLKQPEEAKLLLAKIESRWPEWDVPYLLHGIILESQFYSEEAKSFLETAIALGANDPAAYYYLALATMNATPEDRESIQEAIAQAVRLDPEDPYIRWLAGRDALTNKDYPTALGHLTAAVGLKSDLVEAHYALSAVYRAMGNKDDAAAELKKAERLEKEDILSGAVMSSVRDLLFTVQRSQIPVSTD
ncbi:MAG: tetratricopeptide repeat protein [Acidobacteriota bacterium]